MILWACLVKACVIQTHPPFPILFWYEDWVGNPIWVLNFLNKASGKEPGQLFTHGLALLLVKVLQALLDRPRAEFDVQGVLSNFLGDACQAPWKHVPVALVEADELTFLFGTRTGPDLHSFGRVPSIDLHGLGILIRLENAKHQGHSWAERHHMKLKTEVP
jgi:hypothetical protein